MPPRSLANYNEAPCSPGRKRIAKRALKTRPGTHPSRIYIGKYLNVNYYEAAMSLSLRIVRALKPKGTTSILLFLQIRGQPSNG